MPSAEDGNQQLLQVEDLCGRQLRSFSEHAGPVQCSASADSPERKAEIPPVKALATLEDENDKKVSAKWKNSDGSLVNFCGVRKKG